MIRLSVATCTVVLLVATAQAQEAPNFAARFSGGYAGLTGGYDFRTTDPNFTSPQTVFPAFPFPVVSPHYVSGGKIGGLAGYNAVSGSLLIGVEARGQYSFAEDRDAAAQTFGSATLPVLRQSCFGGCVAFPPTVIGDVQILTDTRYNARLSRPASGDLSLRAGVIFDEWLIFGRAGAGGEYVRDERGRDDSRSRTCAGAVATDFQTGPGRIDTYITSCSRGLVAGPIIKSSTETFSPTITVAGGIERSFGAAFVRVEAEMLVHLPNKILNEVYYTPSANLVLGYRF